MANVRTRHTGFTGVPQFVRPLADGDELLRRNTALEQIGLEFNGP